MTIGRRVGLRGGVGHPAKQVGSLGKRFRTTGGTGSEMEAERDLAAAYPTTTTSTTVTTSTSAPPIDLWLPGVAKPQHLWRFDLTGDYSDHGSVC